MQIHGVIAVRQGEQLKVAIVKVRWSFIIVWFFVFIEIKEALGLANNLFENVNVVFFFE